MELAIWPHFLAKGLKPFTILQGLYLLSQRSHSHEFSSNDVCGSIPTKVGPT